MGKTTSSTPSYSPPVESQIDYQSLMEPMLASMTQMAMMASMNSTPSYTPPPSLTNVPTIDWKSKQTELQNKISADVTSDLLKRRGSASTVLTSPLVNTEFDPSTVFIKPLGTS